MSHFKYLGAPERVTKCKFRNDLDLGDPDEVCNNGSCPGLIDGDCPFSSSDTVNIRFADLFEKVER